MLTEDGFFFNTVDNLRLDTTLTGKQQRKAINKLEKLKLIETDLRGLPPKRHFKPVKDLNRLSELIQEGREKREKLKQKLAENAETSKNRYNGTFKYDKSAETNKQNVRVNNTNETILNNNTKSIGVSIDNSHLPFTSGYQLMKYFVDERKRLHNKDTKLTREKWQEYHNQFDSELHCRVGSKEGHININKDMIDTYMNRQFNIEVDYSIAHFLSGGIISILAVEEGLI